MRHTSEAYLEGMKTRFFVAIDVIAQVRSLPRRNENMYATAPLAYAPGPKPTSKEWKQGLLTYLMYPFLRSEAYLEGMKTNKIARPTYLKN